MSSVAVEGRTGNLPAEVTRFIGRRLELAEARQVLERSRLVTLSGVGGVGKTRLALRLAADVRRSFADGVWLVELSSLRSVELLGRTVADALHLPDQTAGDPLDLLAGYLADRQVLLILDTCEHLVDGCAMLAEVLLRAAPRLRILATSREPLDVMGEHNLVIAPLAATATDSDSVALFADRAEAMVPGFALTDGNREAVAGLCRRLDGIPLAIELAAIRLRGMSMEQVTARIDDRFRLLGTGRGRSRHQTLRATVGWSHELCTDEERLLWARLSVFPGDFDLEAAERVCAGEGLPDTILIDVLGRLVEKSVVLCEADGRRYRMLDTLREYGAEQLDELGERDELRERHRDHYLALAERLLKEARGDRQIPSLLRLRGENANLRVALDHSLATPGEEATGLRMTVVLQMYWVYFGLLGEARAWYARALAAAPEPTAERGWACHAAALFATLQGDTGTPRPLLDEAAELAPGDEELRGHILVTRARNAVYTDDLPTAVACHEAARAVFDKVGYHHSYAVANYSLLGSAHFFSGDLEKAREVCEEGLRACDEHGDLWCRWPTLFVKGGVQWISGEVAGALADAREALRIADALGDLLGITGCLDLVIACTTSSGDAELAALLDGTSEVLWRTLGVSAQFGPHYMELRRQVEETIAGHLPEGRFTAAKERGARLTIGEAVALAFGEPADEPQAGRPDPLTRRERQIAGLVAEGLSNREIAERLIIAKRTADSHVEHILAKLGFVSRTQIAAWAERKRP